MAVVTFEKAFRRVGAGVVLIGALGAFAVAVPAQQPPAADLVLLDARIVTVDARFRTATALAVRDGRFVAVGSNAEARRHIGSATQVIDGRGRTVVPGFIDTHVHALEVASAEATQPFVNLRSIKEVQDWLRREAPGRPQGSWIWTPRVFPTRLREHRFPTRQELDAAVPDHPVVVDSAYAFSLNTAALRAAGITRDSTNPPGGAIVKDAAGEITELRATYDPATRGGDSPDGRRPKATLHWVSAAHAVPAEVRLYDHLFARPDPGADDDLFADLNPASEVIVTAAMLESSLAETPIGETVQFERLGYFTPDADSRPGALVFNRTMTLKDTWAKVQAKG